jgi:hypothetical protein
MSKLCVIIACYNKHINLENIYNFLINIFDIGEFDIFMINNDLDRHDIIKNMYEKKYIVFEGDNSQYEFSGIQKCINMLKDNGIIEQYHSFLLGTDALFNYPIYYFDFINKDIFDYIRVNNVCVGNIDSFKTDKNFDDFKLKYWLRTSMIIINSKLFNNIDYKFMSYKYENVYEKNKLILKFDDSLKVFLSDWLNKEKYKYLDNENKKNIKLSCIFNEWKFTNNIEKYGKIIDFASIYYLNYVFENIVTSKNSILLNNCSYIKTNELVDLCNKSVESQIILKKNMFN